MTKDEYLNELKKRLCNYSRNFREDIIEAFECHFEEGEMEGKSDEEIIEDLGSLDEVMDNIRMLASDEDKKEEKPSFIDFQFDSKSTENNHFNILGVSVEETFRDAEKILRNGISAATQTSKGEFEEVKAAGMEACNEVEIVAIDSAAVDVVIDHGDCLSCSFQPSNSVIFGTCKTIVDARVVDNVLKINMQGKGNGTLKISVTDKIQDLRVDLLSGDIQCDDVSIQKVDFSAISGDISTNRSDFIEYYCNTKSGDIELEESDASEFFLNTLDGDISMRNLHGNIKANTSAGDVSAENCGTSMATLNTKAGDISWKGGCEDLQARTTAGDIDIKHSGEFKRIEATTKAGDIEAWIENTDYTAQLSTVLGDVKNKSNVQSQYHKEKKGLIGNGSASVMLKTVAGDIKLY